MRCPDLSELPPPPSGKTDFPWTEASARVPETTPDGKPMPRLSIVTPSFNQVEFIEETIRSVLLQGYPNLEYMVIDGGSTDGSVDIIRKYADWLDYWVSEPDAGQTAAINKGWRRAQGEIVAWLNSDDTLLPGAVQAAVEFLRARPEIDTVYGDCDYVDSNGQFVWRYPTRPYSYRDLVCSAFNIVPQPAAFIRRRVLEQIGYLDENLHYVMDLDYWLRLGMHHQMAYIPSRLATGRLHEDAKTIGSVRRFAPELIQVYRHLFDTPGLAAPIRALKSKAMSNVYYRAANYFFLACDFAQARRYAMMGWSYAPLNLQSVLFKILVLGWGRLGLWIAKRLSRDPWLKSR